MSSVRRSTVSLRIFGKALEPNLVSGILCCEPTSAAKTGDVITTKSGKRRTIKQGYWHLEYGEADSVELEAKVFGLLNKAIADENAWKTATQGCQADLFCGLFLHEGNEGFSLSAELLREVSKRHLTVGFDIYAPSAGESDDHIDENKE